MNEKSRIFDRQNARLYLDIVKGVAIFLMLWGHCIQYCTNGEIDFFVNPVFKLIYSFHMPLFMIVSGYLFFYSCQRRSLKELMIHRTQALLQPIAFCSILNYFITIVVIERSIDSIISASWIKHLGSLWFLWSVLSSSIVLAIASQVHTNRVVKAVIVLFGFGFVCLFPNWEMNLYMYPYFVAGFCFARFRNSISCVFLNIKYLSLIAFPLMMVFFDKKHYIYTTGIISSSDACELIEIDVFRWAIGFVGSVFVLVIIEMVYNAIVVKKPFFATPISNLGRKSLQVYCISVSVLSFWLPRIVAKICSVVGRNVLVSHIWVYNFVFTPIIAVAYAVLIYYIVKLLERLKLSKLIFGR